MRSDWIMLAEKKLVKNKTVGIRLMVLPHFFPPAFYQTRVG